VAGTGTDAAPFYRVFNPQTQQQRFDPDGAYVRRYVPELEGPGPGGRHVNLNLFSSGPGGYPPPIVDHADERREALDRFNRARQAVRGAEGHGGPQVLLALRRQGP
jgi:deoxyribodipyrimidine photo-lyase